MNRLIVGNVRGYLFRNLTNTLNDNGSELDVVFTFNLNKKKKNESSLLCSPKNRIIDNPRRRSSIRHSREGREVSRSRKEPENETSPLSFLGRSIDHQINKLNLLLLLDLTKNRASISDNSHVL